MTKWLIHLRLIEPTFGPYSYEIKQNSTFHGYCRVLHTQKWVMSAYIGGWRPFKIIWQFDLDLELTLSLNKQYQSCEQQWKVRMK